MRGTPDHALHLVPAPIAREPVRRFRVRIPRGARTPWSEHQCSRCRHGAAHSLTFCSQYYAGAGSMPFTLNGSAVSDALDVTLESEGPPKRTSATIRPPANATTAPARNASAAPSVDATRETTPCATAALACRSASVDNTARPTAPPTCWAVDCTPAARLASCPETSCIDATPKVANRMPDPKAITTSPGNASVQYEPSTVIRERSKTPAATKTKPADSRTLTP